MTDSARLDLILRQLSNMATKDDVQRLDNGISSLDIKAEALDTKADTLDNKIDLTKQDLIVHMDKREHDILNTCLGYTDEQNETIITKLDNIQTTLNTAARLKTMY